MIPETSIEVLLELLKRLHEMLHWTLDGMPEEAFTWQPDEALNCNAVTLWHVSRA